MKQAVKNRLTMLSQNVVAEVTPSNPSLRRWVEVIARSQGGYAVVSFEVSSALDGVNTYLAPGDIQNESTVGAESLDDVLRVLSRMGVDSDAFTVPWETDFPL
ncbi:hypothetical protein OJ997_00460 [Solirubrobacter phytolaccae]|uniref:Uncharacterized protein n=1 Tax=Solirubrobacter phytolaccae TaxID=1404360 RepID=A0A9X3N2Q2_9ACTN|nr:hypothetical protein [Solirubrobacter phytolaccae]MDA0178750.1 hypothetical protein [Solirubrobacter phytolaccae]